MVGTTNLLDAVRYSPSVAAVVIVTTDKVYRPRNASSKDVNLPHTEQDELGAEDPYAWSKVMVEQATAAFRRLPPVDGHSGWSTPVATARAGNVVGGGDWSLERLVPDCIRAFAAGEPVRLRYPTAIRPWQHVLEPLNGYLVLAESLASGADLAGDEQGVAAFNFGPFPTSERTVEEVARAIAVRWSGTAVVDGAAGTVEPPENPLLRLDSHRASVMLGWQPKWDLPTTVDRTTDWYRREAAGEDAAALVQEQLADYSQCFGD